MQKIKKWWKKVKMWDISLNITDWTHWTVKDDKNWDFFLLSCKNIKSWNIIYDFNDRKIDKLNFEKLNKRTKLEYNDVLITTVWTIWETAIIKDKKINYEFQRSVAIIKPNMNEVIPLYLFYYVSWTIYQNDIKWLSRWVAQQCLFLEPIRNSEILLPPLPTQQKTASILLKYDDLIDNNNKRIKILEETAQAIYEEWFVKYNFPWNENIKMIDSDNDDFPIIPEGWGVWRLEDYIQIIKWISYKSTELSDNWFSFVNLKCFNRWWWFRRGWIKWFTWTVKLEKKVFPWDLVMAVTDMTQWREIVARVAMIPNTIAEATISCDVVKIEPKNIDKSYLYYFLRFSTFSENTKMKANWANVLHLSPSVIWEFDVILPEKNIIKIFWKITEKIISEMDNLEIQNQKLKETRDLLIPRLVSGELDVESLDVK